MNSDKNHGRETGKPNYFSVPLKSSSKITSSTTKDHHHSFLHGMNPFDKHKKLVQDYMSYYHNQQHDVYKNKHSSSSSSLKNHPQTDIDILKKHHQFLREEDQILIEDHGKQTNNNSSSESWEIRLAKKYYKKLFKEYCLADLRKYKEGKIAMRWRVEREVKEGKGQFECGNISCPETLDLKAWEVPFGYLEHGEKKMALVKLKLCEDCSYRLNYRKLKENNSNRKQKERLIEKEQLKRRISNEERIEKQSQEFNNDGSESYSDDYNHAKSNSVSQKHDEEKEDLKESSSPSSSTKKRNESEQEEDTTSSKKLKQSNVWSSQIIEQEKDEDDDMNDYLADLFG